MDFREMDCKHVNSIKLSRLLCLWWWTFHFHNTRDFLKHSNMPTVQGISHTFKRWSIHYFLGVSNCHADPCKYVKEVSVRCSALCYHLLPLPQHLLHTSLLLSLKPDITESTEMTTYEGWNFNSGNYLFTTDTE